MFEYLIKAKNIIFGKEIEVEILQEYDEERVEVEIIEGVFTGKRAIVYNKDIVKYEICEIMANKLIKLLKENNIEFEYYESFHFNIEGKIDEIYVCINDLERYFYMERRNKFIDYEDMARNYIYYDDSETWKNQCTRKTAKGTLNYIKRFL